MLNFRFCVRQLTSYSGHSSLLTLHNSRKLNTEVKEAVNSLDTPKISNDLEEVEAREAYIEKSRNKSKLNVRHFKKQNNLVPDISADNAWQQSLRFKRRLYGKFGKASNVNPSILWPSNVELDAIKEYEAVLQPMPFREVVARVQENKKLEEIKVQKIEDEIFAKVANIKKELYEFHKKVALNKEKALALSQKKNKIVEEIRRQFGYKIHVKDEKFKEVYKQRQEEEKKKMKLAKKAEKEKYKALKAEKSVAAAKPKDEEGQNKELL